MFINKLNNIKLLTIIKAIELEKKIKKKVWIWSYKYKFIWF